jgi:hypothetical protein
MNLQKVETVTDRLFENVLKVRYGSASVTLQIHEGRITTISYSTTENTREREDRGSNEK